MAGYARRKRKNIISALCCYVSSISPADFELVRLILESDVRGRGRVSGL